MDQATDTTICLMAYCRCSEAISELSHLIRLIVTNETGRPSTV